VRYIATPRNPSRSRPASRATQTSAGRGARARRGGRSRHAPHGHPLSRRPRHGPPPPGGAVVSQPRSHRNWFERDPSYASVPREIRLAGGTGVSLIRVSQQPPGYYARDGAPEFTRNLRACGGGRLELTFGGDEFRVSPGPACKAGLLGAIRAATMVPRLPIWERRRRGLHEVLIRSPAGLRLRRPRRSSEVSPMSGTFDSRPSQR
jgi:hypothetical protein